jgi:hypothetical protein
MHNIQKGKREKIKLSDLQCHLSDEIGVQMVNNGQKLKLVHGHDQDEVHYQLL